MYNQVFNNLSASNSQGHYFNSKVVDGKRVGVKFDFAKPLTIARCDKIVQKLREFFDDETINSFTAERSVWQFEEDEEYVKNYPFQDELASTNTSKIVIKYTQNAFDNETLTFGHKEIHAYEDKSGVLITYVHSGDKDFTKDEVNSNFLEFAESKIAEALAEQQAKREAFELELAEKGETVHYTEKKWNDLWREKTSQTSDNTGFDWSSWDPQTEEFAEIDNKDD